MEHGHGNEHENARQDRNTALTGLGVALVWLAILATICYNLVPKE